MVTIHVRVEIARSAPGSTSPWHGSGTCRVRRVGDGRLDDPVRPARSPPAAPARPDQGTRVRQGRHGPPVEVDRGAYAAPRVIRDTEVRAEQLTAGADGARVCIFTATAGADEPVAVDRAAAFHGPLDEALTWRTVRRSVPRRHGELRRGLEGYLAPVSTSSTTTLGDRLRVRLGRPARGSTSPCTPRARSRAEEPGLC